MALSIDGIQILRNYFNGVMDRANHHAENVNEIALAILGGIIWKSTDEIQVKQYAGSPANILWMYVGENKYCFAFNHETGNIEVRRASYKGEVIIEFNNTSSVAEVKQFFEAL